MKGDRALALDAGTIGVVSLAICVAADRLAFMTAFVPVVIAARFVLWTRLPKDERGEASLGREVLFFGVCTVLGAFNDWNSVVRHGIYAYGVPHYSSLSTIPAWMLLFWGMILRSLISLFRWPRIAPGPRPRNQIHIGHWVSNSGVLKVAVQLGLVFATRQAIYRTWEHPVWSWIPFALALMLYVVLVRPDPGVRRVMVGFAIAGPMIEALYIRVGGLHTYALGWLAGVPLWIALWWVLAVAIWMDLGLRLQDVLSSWMGSSMEQPVSPLRAPRHTRDSHR